MKSTLGLDETQHSEPVQVQPIQYQPIQSTFRCPYCQSNAGYIRQSKTSTGGWIVFAVLLLVCFPLFWIGFLIQDSQDVCVSCRVRLN